MHDASPPPARVLAGFGACDEPRLLPGGQGRIWRAGDVVLKPVDDPDQHAWVCAAWAAWPADADPTLLHEAWRRFHAVTRIATRGCNEARGATRPGSDGYVSRRGRSLDLLLARL